jgi:hypothetical protein
MSRFELRILLHSWGLLVDVDLTVHVADEKPSNGMSITEGTYLVVAPSAEMWEGDLPEVLNGLRRVEQTFRTALSLNGRALVFVLGHLWYPLTDSQCGAVELAVTCWAAERLEISEAPAKISFDDHMNSYRIEFDDEIWGEVR